MNKFKYTITWTQTISPSQWNLPEMSKNLVRVRNQAYDTEAKLIEQELDRRGLVDAQQIIKNIMERK